MKKSFVKNLIAALIAFVAAYFAKAEVFNWLYVTIYVVGFTIVYFGKNFLWPSTSPLGFIDVWDLLSGLIIALGAGLSDLAAQWITVHVIDWHILWITVSGSVVAYILSKFGWGPKNATIKSVETTVTLPPK